MATDIVYDAVRGFLDANGGAIEFRYENETRDPPNGDATFVMVEIAGDIMEQGSIGAGEPKANAWREAGTLHLTVQVPSGSGSGGARRIARQLAELFRGLDLQPGITFRDISIGLGDVSSMNGRFWGLPVGVDWHRDF